LWAEAALDAWEAIERDALRGRGDRLEVLDGPHGEAAALWPLAHVLWAAAEAVALGARVDVEGFHPFLRRFRVGDAYAATPGGRRFFDDNAWLGLASLRLLDVTGDDAHRRRATRVAAFVRRGETRTGGVRWAERSPSRNACSTAAGAWLLLELAAHLEDPEAAVFAARSMDWLNGSLRRPDGLIADRIVRGKVVRTTRSYNQGAAIAAGRRLGRSVDELVAAALGRFRDDRLWREPPAFSCILFRALLEKPSAAVLGVLDPYLERLLNEGRDRATGWFTAGGVGSYDGRPTIDQAAVVQLFALRAQLDRAG
jgi:hypothetical protein